MKDYAFWKQNITPDELASLDALPPDTIADAFARPLAFGTAGMRGLIGIGTFRMNSYTVARATKGLAAFIISQNAEQRGVVIAYDTRRFSREFAAVAAEILSASGIKVFLYDDVRPVPVCSYRVRKCGAFAGIMLTASHNPKEYNGYKVYGEDGAQMSPENTDRVVSFIENTPYFGLARDKKLINIISDDEDYYKEVLAQSVSADVVKKYGKDVKLVYSPLHGAGRIPVLTVFKKLGINALVVKEQEMPDTEFSTVAVPNPEFRETLSMGIALAQKNNAELVIATDPDCDRIGVAVRNSGGDYVILTGNQLGALLLDYILERLNETGKLPKNGAVVKSIVTTTLADRIAESYGVACYNVLTGFKFIGEKIAEWEKTGQHTFLFGYEESNGVLRGTHARDKDAVVGSMLFAEALIYDKSRGSSIFERLEKIFKKFGYYTENNLSIAYKGAVAMEEMAAVMASLRKKEVSTFAGEKVVQKIDFLDDGTGYPKSDMLLYYLSDKQFVCVRPSGTEPKLKIYVLAFDKTQPSATKKGQDIMSAARALVE